MKGWTYSEPQADRRRYLGVKVEEITANPPVKDEDFRVECIPGMYIQDEYFFINPLTRRLDSSSGTIESNRTDKRPI